MKKLLYFSTLFVLLTCLTACSGGGSNGDITVTFWHAMGEANQTVIQKIIDDFEALPGNENITVEQVSKGGYPELTGAIRKGAPVGMIPSLAQTYPDHVADYLAQYAVLPMDDFINDPTYGLTEADIADFVPSFYEEGSSYDKEGTMYSLPFNKSTEVLFYNKTIFEKYGWTAPETWADIERISTEYITKPEYTELSAEDKAKAAAFSSDSVSNLFITLTQQYGGEYTGFGENGEGLFLFNNAKSKEAIGWFKDNVDAGKFATPTKLGANYSSDAFKQGKVIMTIGSSAGAKYNQPSDNSFEVGITTYPQKDINEKQVIQQGTNVTMFNVGSEAEQLATWKFVKYLTGPEAALDWSLGTSYFPIRNSVKETKVYQAYLNGYEYLAETDSFLDIANNETGEQGADGKPDVVSEPSISARTLVVADSQKYDFYTNVAFPGTSETRTQAEKLINAVLYGGVSLDDAYVAAMREILSSLGK